MKTFMEWQKNLPAAMYGTGGMATKLAAAKIATLSGTDMIIANGGDVRILQDISKMIMWERYLRLMKMQTLTLQIILWRR